jgi:hypothetical protein
LGAGECISSELNNTLPDQITIRNDRTRRWCAFHLQQRQSVTLDDHITNARLTHQIISFMMVSTEISQLAATYVDSVTHST